MVLENLIKKAKTGLVVGATIASMAVAGNAMSQVRSVDGRVGSHEVTSSVKLTDARAPRRVSGRVTATDPHTTLIAMPEYDVEDGNTTRIEVMNGTIEDADILAVGREGHLGFPRRNVDLHFEGRGTFKDWISNLFGPYERWAEKIDLRVANADAENLFGKLTSTLRIVGPMESTESAFSFNSAQRPMHTLSLPYRPQDASLTELVVSNEASSGIDVYLRAPSGQEFLLKEYLGLHRQTTFDFSGFNHITHGDIVAYRAGTSIPIDGLVGTMKFRYDDDYKRAEGYALRGASVDGTHEFSSEFYMPLSVIEQMSALERDTDGWEKFMYQNKTDSDQLLVVRHFDNEGQQIDAIALDVSAHGMVAEMPQDLGIARQLGGTLQFSVRDVNGNEDPLAFGDMVYLAGDMPDGVAGSSVLAGGLVPSLQNKSKYLRFPLTHAGDTRQVFVIHNPHDSETILDFGAFSLLGSAITHNLPDNVTIPPHGTVAYNSQDAVALGFDASSISVGNNGLVGVVLNYSTTPVKDQLSASGTIMEAVNEPKAKYEIDRIDVEGQINPDIANAFLNQITGFILDYRTITATQRVDRFDMLVDGVKVAEYDEPTNMFQGQIGFNYEFMEAGIHKVTFRGYADDGNVHKDFSRSIDVNVIDQPTQINVNTLEWRDRDGNIIPVGDVSSLLEENDEVNVNYNINIPGHPTAHHATLMWNDNGVLDSYETTNIPVTDGNISGSLEMVLGDAGDYTVGVILFDSSNTSLTEILFDPAYTWANVPAEENIDIYDGYDRVVSGLEELSTMLSQPGVTWGPDQYAPTYQDNINYLSDLIDGTTSNHELLSENGIRVAKIQNKLVLNIEISNGTTVHEFYTLPDEEVEDQVYEFFTR